MVGSRNTPPCSQAMVAKLLRRCGGVGAVAGLGLVALKLSVECAAHPLSQGLAFITVPEVPPFQASGSDGIGRGLRPVDSRLLRTRGPAAASSSAAAAALLCASAAVAVALRLTYKSMGRSRSTMYGWDPNASKMMDKAWFHVPETEDPCSLPMRERDFKYAHEVPKRAMIEARKGKFKIFWKVRVMKQQELGCQIEVLCSGLPAWCPRIHEGPERLEPGAEVWMQCIATPLARVNQGERRRSPWPDYKNLYPIRGPWKPIYSHWNWIQTQKNKEFAKGLKVGDIVDGHVHSLQIKGMIIDLEGYTPLHGGAKGFITKKDVSKLHAFRIHLEKYFPPGTKIRCMVSHVDYDLGRITLSTKEFEDDYHVGWMLSFPEYCYKHAERGVAEYFRKRENRIKQLQR